jgi:hypothetical protein
MITSRYSRNIGFPPRFKPTSYRVIGDLDVPGFMLGRVSPNEVHRLTAIDPVPATDGYVLVSEAPIGLPVATRVFRCVQLVHFLLNVTDDVYRDTVKRPRPEASTPQRCQMAACDNGASRLIDVRSHLIATCQPCERALGTVASLLGGALCP